jgi:hypothetical protein
MAERLERVSLRKIAEFMGIYIHKRSVKDERTGDLFWRVGVGDGTNDLPTFLTRFDDDEEAERFIDANILLLIEKGE